MDTSIQSSLRLSVQKFRMPRYHELPNVGLYLEQVAKYVNNVLSPLNCAEITTSMISNYVKKGFIPSPQKKQYDVDRVIYILFTAVVKNVLALEDIVELIEMQKQKYSLPVAYDYFCSELENMLVTEFSVVEQRIKEGKHPLPYCLGLSEDSHRYGSPNCEAAGKQGALFGLESMLTIIET